MADARKLETFYTNRIGLAVNPVEVALFFALETPQFATDGASETSIRNIVADVRMHPSLAKQLMIQLQESLAAYEEKYGALAKAEKPQEKEASNG